MNPVYEKLQGCLKSVREKTDFVPKVAIVLGSGLGDYANDIKVVTEIDYSDIEQLIEQGKDSVYERKLSEYKQLLNLKHQKDIVEHEKVLNDKITSLLNQIETIKNDNVHSLKNKEYEVEKKYLMIFLMAECQNSF
mgnify:CR=1 FL=1